MSARDETEELLPCPFCGSPAEIIDIEDGENAGGSCVSCTRCEASSALDFGRKENFVSKWNTRPSPARDEGAGTMEVTRAAEDAACAAYRALDMGQRWTLEPAMRAAIKAALPHLAAPVSAPGMDREEGIRGPHEPAALGLNGPSDGEEFLEFKEALSDLRSLRHEYECLNGGGPGWQARNAEAWKRADELFADEDEAAWHRQQEDAHG